MEKTKLDLNFKKHWNSYTSVKLNLYWMPSYKIQHFPPNNLTIPYWQTIFLTSKIFLLITLWHFNKCAKIFFIQFYLLIIAFVVHSNVFHNKFFRSILLFSDGFAFYAFLQKWMYKVGLIRKNGTCIKI